MQQINELINSVIMVADKFIDKVDTGMARSKETYADLQKLRSEANTLKVILENNKIDIKSNDNELYNYSILILDDMIIKFFISKDDARMASQELLNRNKLLQYYRKYQIPTCSWAQLQSEEI